MFVIISMLQSLIKNYDQDMETLTKQQKQQVEKAEASQTVDLKNAAKRIKIEQVCPCKGHCILTLSLLAVTCGILLTFANSLDPDQDRQNVGPDLDPNRLHARI